MRLAVTLRWVSVAAAAVLLLACKSRNQATLLWQVQRLSVPACQAPILKSAVLLQDGNGLLHANDVATGKPLWKVDADVLGLTSARDRLACGADSIVTARATRLERFSASDGSRLWSADFQCRWEVVEIFGQALVGICVKPQGEGDAGPASWALIAVDLANGHMLWSKDKVEGRFDSDGSLLAISENGTRPAPDQATSPRADEQRSNLLSVELRSGRVVWQRPVAGAGIVPLVRKDVVLALAQPQVVAFDARSGRQLWSRPFRAGETAFFGFAAGLFAPHVTGRGVVVADESGLVELSFSTGHNVGRIPWPRGVGRGDLENFLVDGEKLYLNVRPEARLPGLQCWDGTKWSRVRGGAPLGTPAAILDGIMVFRDDRDVLVYRLQK